MGKSSAVTTRELETLAEAVSRLAATRSRCDRRRRSVWRAWRDDLVGQVHRAVKPAVRPYAGKVLVGVAASLLADLERAWRWADELDELIDAAEGELAAVRLQRAQLEREQQETAKRMAALEHELAQTRARRVGVARRPAATSLVLPAQKITVESPIQREVLRLLAVEGLGRVWRIVERVLDSELTGNANVIRNAVNRLAERGLLANYEQHGKPVTWAYKAGGARRLVQLTPTGRLWCRGAFGREPVESEIAVAARRHRSIAHGVAILEARDLLRGCGIAVDDDPAALLATAERWHARAEPDLAMTLADGVWPIEVQKEVAGRRTDKWAKTLALAGRLALILFSADAARKQVAILQNDLRSLPAGVIRVTSLEALEAGDWDWLEIVVPE